MLEVMALGVVSPRHGDTLRERERERERGGGDGHGDGASTRAVY